jgi:hypothetical protein
VTIRAGGRYEQPLFADELPPLDRDWHREHDLNVRGARAPTSASKAGRLGHSRIPAKLPYRSANSWYLAIAEGFKPSTSRLEFGRSVR